MKNNRAALLAVAMGNVIFGFSFLFSKIALEVTIPTVLIAIRFVTAFIVFYRCDNYNRKRVCFKYGKY